MGTTGTGLPAQMAACLALWLVFAASAVAAQGSSGSSNMTASLPSCALRSEQISLDFPITHNCTQFDAETPCTVHCDESLSFVGDPITITCSEDGRVDMFPTITCLEAIHHIETDRNGMHLHVYKGDVFVEKDELRVGLLNMHARLSTEEAYTLNQRVVAIEAANLPSEISSSSSALESSITSLETATAASDELLSSAITSEVGSLESATSTSVLSLETAITSTAESLSGDITTLTDKQEDISTAVSDLSEALGGSLGTLSDLVDDVSAIVSEHDTALNTNTDDIADLEARVSILQGLAGDANIVGQHRTNPGLDCSHILQLQNGENLFGDDGDYWIDPNGGAVDDAFKVKCDMTNGGWTMIEPAGNVELARHDDGDGRFWLDEVEGPFEYDIAEDQLTALVARSTEATQNVTFTCRGVIIYTAPDGSVYGGAAYFRTFGDPSVIWSINGNGIPYTAVHDNCGQNQNSVTETAEFFFETKYPEQLPVTSINIFDAGDPGEEFGIEYKAVMFRSSPQDGRMQAHAAPSCSHILRDYPQSRNGYYWIDPNLGSTSDAFKARCDMTSGGWTLIQPSSDIARGKWKTGGDGYIWFSDVEQDAISWDITESQLLALQRMSTHARQDFQFQCKGVIVYYYDSAGDTDLRHVGASLRFRSIPGSNDGIFWSVAETESPSLYNPEFRTQNDDCRVNDNVWRTADFVLDSGNAMSLPVRDVQVQDHGDTNEEWGIEFQPVRFITMFGLPLGSSPANPARTCVDILRSGRPDARNGYYFIDPNGGSYQDSMYLECDMTRGGWTGIEPKRQIPHKNWFTGSDGARWFSTSISGGFQFSYDITEAQLSALQAVSNSGYQEATVTCRGVIVYWGPDWTVTGDHLWFTGGLLSNEFEWHPGAQPPYRYTVPQWEDGCYDNSESLVDSAKFYFDTGVAQAMPVRDVRVSDIGGSNEQWGMTLSKAWFRD